MSHDLSRNRNGSYEMMCVGEKPWHRLGTVLEQPPATAVEAITVADYGLTSARDSKWLDGVWFGESYRIKTLAFDAAMQIVKNKDTVSVAAVTTQ